MGKEGCIVNQRLSHSRNYFLDDADDVLVTAYSVLHPIFDIEFGTIHAFVDLSSNSILSDDFAGGFSWPFACHVGVSFVVAKLRKLRKNDSCGGAVMAVFSVKMMKR